ncbi:MAG: GerMN domain-containing protein, partial [Treponemataceae bacterium]|nr:GerMN domain-containing protein [Treponemataceae bacterium]
SVPHLKHCLLCTLLAVLLAFSVSFGCWLHGLRGRRYVFLFPSAGSGRLCAESRRLSARPGADAVAQYVDELLLGPVSEYCEPLFPVGTAALFCFVRSSTLFVNVSAEALQCAPVGADFHAVIALFEKNVRRNFPSIRSVDFFIDGNAVFETVP